MPALPAWALGYEYAWDMGSDHYAQWIDRDGTKVGLMIHHRDARSGLGCASGPRFARTRYEVATNAVLPLWTVAGPLDEHVTLTPSIRCSCGDHGFVREGKWVDA